MSWPVQILLIAVLVMLTLALLIIFSDRIIIFSKAETEEPLETMGNSAFAVQCNTFCSEFISDTVDVQNANVCVFCESGASYTCNTLAPPPNDCAAKKAAASCTLELSTLNCNKYLQNARRAFK